ncbi:MAG: LPS assembly protein LptD [Pseudomonadota bacterium]
MNLSRRITFLLPFFAVGLVAQNSWAIPSLKKGKDTSPHAVLKADEIDGDQATKTLVATGNVEIAKGTSTIYADKVTYNKNGGIIHAFGHVRIKDLEVGNVRASKLEIKDDFSSGKFYDTKMIFTDGSYLDSPEIDRQTPFITVLQNPIFSICPNPEIVENNELAGKQRDFVSIKSRVTTIDREQQVMRSRGGILRFYNIPVLYTPYLRVPLQSKKRESGFLNPSYAKSTNLGLGIRLPYYFNIAPNMDLTVTPLIGVSNNQFIINNDLRHFSTYGNYQGIFEIANNKITSNLNTTVTNRTNKEYRWNLTGNGIFDFTKNIGLDFIGNTVGDKDYLRDYHYNYLNYTLTKVNLDYIKGREYHAVKIIRIQELEPTSNEEAAPLILPQIDSHIETKPYFFKEKFALTSNMTVITRQDGLQYRRATMTPEANLPFNLHGNLFAINARAQTDAYSLENNFQFTSRTNDYDSVQTNVKPELSMSWRLPLIRKSETNTLMIEPMINVVTSTFTKNFAKLPNEDSNDSELSVSNLFVADRISGFDRNESGKRVNYGVKSSLFNKFGEFGLTIGQGYRKEGNSQDVVIRGFTDNNKSNIVGQALYKAVKYFVITYSFQLSESNYSNQVNQVTAALNLDRFSFSSDYLLIRKTIQNPDQKEQINLSASMKVTPIWKVTTTMTKDLQSSRTLSRGITLYRDGCCTIFGFSAIETNPSSLTKPQKTFNLSLSFKNL